MILDLSDPFTGTIAGGIVLLIIGGTYHYIVSLVTFIKTKEQLSNVFSELDTLHKNYKNEIADIKKRHGSQLENSLKLTQATINLYEQKMDKLIHDNRPSKPFSLYAYAQSKNQK